MLNLNEVAQWLTEVFNEQSKNFDPIYTFNIYAEVGEDKNNVDVQGVLKVDIPKNAPVNKIVNARYYGDIEFTVSAPRSNYNLANVEKIIGGVAKEINGTEKVFANGKGFVTMSVAGTGNFKTEYSQGNIVPLRVKLDINYSENVVTGGGKHWYIKELIGDYIEIPFITERVTIEKDGKVSPINDRAYKQAFMLAQQRSYMFTLPYDTTVGALITRDILKGDANKNYKLKYIDGVAFTENDPFETQVVLYRNGDNGETKPDTAMLNIIFTDADDGNNETKYSLALIDNEFDGTSENTRWFDSIADQQAWFTTKIANGADYDSIDAPNLNNLVLTNQIYKNTRGYDIFDLVNKNYAVIKVIKGENEPQYYYYRVTNADIGANGQVIYTLRLDGVQTWLFRDNLIIDDSFISKAHLDRWIDNGDGSISFNFNADSKLFTREEIRDLPKRLIERYKLLYDLNINYVNQSGNDDFAVLEPKPEFRFFNKNYESLYYLVGDIYKLIPSDITETDYNNIANVYVCQKKYIEDGLSKIPFWVYVYFSSSTSKTYTIKKRDGSNKTDYNPPTIKFKDFRKLGANSVTNKDYSDIELPYSVLCYPLIYGGGDQYLIEVKDNLTGQTSHISDYHLHINSNGFNNFLSLNEGFTNYIISIKVSIKPPFDLTSIKSYDVNSNMNRLLFNTNDLNTSLRPDIITIPYSLDVNDMKARKLQAIRTAQIPVTTDGSRYDGVFVINYDYNTPVPLYLRDEIAKFTFLKNDIIGKNKNKQFNPKLNSQDYKYLSLVMTGNNFEFPLDKMNNVSPKFEYFEELKPDITRGLLRFYSTDQNSIFNKEYSESFNGFSFQNDFNIGIKVDAYAEYISTNKNAFAQLNAQLAYNTNQTNLTNAYIGANFAYDLLRTGANAGLNFISGGAKGLVGATTDAAISYGKMRNQQYENIDRTNLQNDYEKTKFDLSIDNMKNSPSSLKNLNGSALYSHIINKFGIYAEIYEGLDTELESANDMMFRDGYNLNRFEESGKSIRDYCHTRKYFNYIKATLGNIHGVPMSDTMRADLKERFANGIRFWHQDTIDYSMENYELNLVTE